MITLDQIDLTLENVPTQGGEIKEAINDVQKARDLLHSALAHLDTVQVSGRQALDSLLGGMMAIEAILGILNIKGE